jgi:hypothetical protein
MPEPDVSDVRAAFPEWEIDSDCVGIWHAELVTAPRDEPQPCLVAGSLADLARALNHYVAGGDP